MKNRLEILKEIDKNLTYESIRFNNKQISDEIIKSTIDQFFPKLFFQDKWKDIAFFTKAMKDEEFYKKVRILVSIHLKIQQRQNEKSKIQDSSSHGVQELNNKKMTRAALAKRNQQTQQQLRKDQIFVRLTPKSQQCLQWMLCNRKFPRIECKLSCNQHIEYLINYLSNKWLPGKGHNRIVLYPDVGSYLKNSLTAKQRQKILKQPLNNYFMFTDVMMGCGIGQNGILNLHYDILQKKKDSIRPQTLKDSSGIQEKALSEKKDSNSCIKVDQGLQTPKKVINLDEVGDSNKKSASLVQKQEKYQNYVPVSNPILKPSSNEQHQKNIFLSQPKQESLHNVMNNHSNHYLSNESNLLNPNRSIYHDDESIFKSIGFFNFGTGNQNSIGFRKNDFNLISINSNSLIDIQPIHQSSKQGESKLSNQNKSLQSLLQSRNQLEQKSLQQMKQIKPKETSKIKDQTVQNLSSPKYSKVQKSSGFQSPVKETTFKKQLKEKQNSKSNEKPCIGQEQQEQSNNDAKKHQQKLLDLRNAINLLQQVQGFNDQQCQPQEEISQKSGLKQIKTVSIKKKIIN